MELGRVGIWSNDLARKPFAATRAAVTRIEDLGFRTIWYPEGANKEAMSLAALLLAATDHLVVATGIANVWARDAQAAANGARTLAEAHPDRFVLGLGVSHAPAVAVRGHVYQRPLHVMERYPDALDDAAYYGTEPASPAPVVLAALGPRMLRLAAERTWGAHPYFVPVDHTPFARSILGDGPLLAPEQAPVLSADRDEARAIGRLHTSRYLLLDNYRNNLLRMGWEARHLEEGGSDELVDALVVWGGPDAARERVGAHLEAGADHVSVQVLTGDDTRFPLEELATLAPALLDL